MKMAGKMAKKSCLWPPSLCPSALHFSCYNIFMALQLLVAFLVSMVPLLELRGAIPIAVALNYGAPEWAILLAATLGNILPVPFIFHFAKKILDWGANRCPVAWFKKCCRFFLKHGEKAGQKLLKNIHGGVYWALYLFVAVPVPGTGAWTGTLAATILNLDRKKTMISVISGVATAGLIMLLASLGLFRLIFGG